MAERGRDALLVVDVQNDFCAGGSLAVPDGDAVVPVVNRVAASFARRGEPVLASRDWHPRHSRHFSQHGGRWPVHCVAGTPGAQFHPRLNLPADARIVTKGDTPEAEGYSAFDGHLPGGKSLAETLEGLGVTRLVVAGLATDYCVLESAMDARRAGLDVVLLQDAVRAVDVESGDGNRALAAMADAGIVLAQSASFVTPAGRETREA